MTPRTASRIARSVVALTFLLTAASMALVVAAYGRPHEGMEPGGLLAVAGIFIPWSVVGAVVASRRPENRIGWMFVLAALGMSVSLAANAYAGYSVIAGAGWPVTPWAAWLNTWLWSVTGIAAPVVLFLIFPDGRFLSAFWRQGTIVLLIAAAATVTADALNPGPLDGFPTIPNPIGIESPVRDALSSSGPILVGPLVMAFAVASLLLRLRRSKGDERAQIKWVVFTAAVACIGFLTGFAASSFVGFMVGLVALAATPLAAGVAILKYHLYDIDRAVNRTVVYGLLSVLLAGLYFGIVLALQQAFSGLTRGNDLAIAGSTLAVAALFRPARRRIQALVDRRFYRRRYDAQQTLAAFGARLRDEVDLDTLGGDLAAVVHETMQPAHVSLWLRTPEASQ